MLSSNHSKKLLKFIENENEDGFNNYVLKKLNPAKCSESEMSFIEQNLFHNPYGDTDLKNIFQVLIEFGWRESIDIIFSCTTYKPRSIQLDCMDIAVYQDVDSTVALSQYLKSLYQTNSLNPNQIEHFGIENIKSIYYILLDYETIINTRMNKYDKSNDQREHAFANYFYFIGVFFDQLDADELRHLFFLIDENDKKQAAIYKIIPYSSYRNVIPEEARSYIKIFKSLSHFGDEAWIRDNFMLDMFRDYYIENEMTPFNNYQGFLSYLKTQTDIFQETQQPKRKLTAKLPTKSYPAFFSPKKGVISIEEGDEFCVINFLDAACDIKHMGNQIQFRINQNIYTISMKQFQFENDFYKVKNYVWNILRGNEIDFPNLNEKISLSITHTD